MNTRTNIFDHMLTENGFQILFCGVTLIIKLKNIERQEYSFYISKDYNTIYNRKLYALFIKFGKFYAFE